MNVKKVEIHNDLSQDYDVYEPTWMSFSVVSFSVEPIQTQMLRLCSAGRTVIVQSCINSLTADVNDMLLTPWTVLRPH